MADQDGDLTQTFVALAAGTNVLHYEIIEKIGAGGMGEVYLADDTKLNRRVALKFLPADMVKVSDVRARFTREAQAVAKHDHPNIVTIYEVSEFNGRPFFAMQYVEGQTLHHFCHEEPLSIQEIVSITLEICQGLKRAHAHGIIHRDIKSANILIDQERHPRIVDFGLAAVQGSDQLTKTGSTLGTLAYMSPEQVKGQDVDHRSDLFSLGVVLYELIAGQTPFKREYSAATMYAILQDAPEPLPHTRFEVPDRLRQVVSKLLSKDVSARYQSATEVIDDLEDLAAANSSTRSAITVARRSPGWAPFAVVAGVLVIAILVWSLWGSSNDPSIANEIMFTIVTDDGKVSASAISPDGNYVSFIREDAGTWSLWIKHISTGSRVQLLEPSSVAIDEPSFSPDGSFVYYLASGETESIELYRIPVLGGRPQFVMADVDSRVSFSPDGSRVAFFRYSQATSEGLIVSAASDGTDEQILDSRGGDEYYFGAPAWSPDGKVIACTRGLTRPRVQSELVMLDALAGEEVWAITGDWINPLSIGWLPDGTGLVFAVLSLSSPFGSQIWHVTYPEGSLRKITNDLNDYGGLSLTTDGQQLAVSQEDMRAGIWLVSIDEPDAAKQILFGRYDGMAGMSWVDNNTLMHFTRTGDDCSLGRFDIDSDASQTLLVGDPIVSYPSVPEDGSIVVYQNWTDSGSGLAMCDLDGRNQWWITRQGEFQDPRVSSDGKWVIAAAVGEDGVQTAVKVSIESGEPTTLSTKPAIYPRFSPDDQTVVCLYLDPSIGAPKMAILPSEGGNPLQLLDLPSSFKPPFGWSHDGLSVMYVEARDGLSNVWSQPLDGSSPTRVTDFRDREREIASFELSPNGKTLAVCRTKTTRDVVLIRDFH